MPRILFFGPLADVTHCRKMNLSGISSTHELMDKLYSDFPELTIRKFRIAVNENIVHKNSNLSENDVVALLPPFAGG